MKRIVVFFTGGTISMLIDSKINAIVPGISNQDIIRTLTNIGEIAEIEITEIGPFPGPHVTPDLMMSFLNISRSAIERNDVDGLVITHGTDTLEETAYFFYLTLVTKKPVVFTGSMRNSSELGYDGPANLTAAICVAADDNSYDKGVLVVFNNEVNSASEVIKFHTMKLGTFISPNYGPIGIVDNNRVIYHRSLFRKRQFNISVINSRVSLLKAFIGIDSDMIKYFVDSGKIGIVIEAMGRGNLPPETLPGIKYAIGNGIPVVITSRCYAGRVLDSYGYAGGGRNLMEIGAIFGGELSSLKARIKLMVLLSFTSDKLMIHEYFNE